MGSVREDVRDQLSAIRETLVDNWRDVRAFVQETWPALVVLLVLLVLAIWVADPAPPRHVVVATGPAGSSNEALGQAYQRYFAERGIAMTLVPTEGSVENVARLQDQHDPVRAAFVMAGAARPHSPGIQTLGSVNYQPFWCFYRGAEEPDSIRRAEILLSGSLNVGTPGSGTHLISERVISLSGYDIDQSHFKQMPDLEAIQALAQHQLDGMCIVDTYESPNVQKLIAMPGLQLVNFERADAFARRVPEIEAVRVPEGGLRLKDNFPSKAYTLLASTTEIQIDHRLHPAIQTLFLMAARHVNGRESFFSNEGQFPAFMDSTQTRSKEAEIFYDKGVPLLVEYLPFWVAEFIRRLVITLLPFAAIAYPFLRSMPNYYKKRVRSRIDRMYGGLKFFEQSLVTHYDPAQKSRYLTELDALEREALGMRVPKSVTSDYYTLRSSIDYVRNCVLRDGYNVHAAAQAPMAFAAGTQGDDGDGDEI